MGLCSCPKKTVTNQFCYVHRQNVCEACMISSHPKCVINSYLQWLKDTDYEPICVLCKSDLEIDECIRLVCYHVFHWKCVDEYGRCLPATTAPSGYTCPTCRHPIIPQPNLISPVADVLRERISSVNWARVGLDLPLVSDEDRSFRSTEKHQTASKNTFYNNESSNKEVLVYMNENSNSYGINEFPDNVPRRLGHTTANSSFYPGSLDDDENKYVRKSIFGSSWRKWRRFCQCSKYITSKIRRPFVLIFVIFIIILMVSLYNRMTINDVVELKERGHADEFE